jgi:hypothetical protein
MQNLRHFSIGGGGVGAQFPLCGGLLLVGGGAIFPVRRRHKRLTFIPGIINL